MRRDRHLCILVAGCVAAGLLVSPWRGRAQTPDASSLVKVMEATLKDLTSPDSAKHKRAFDDLLWAHGAAHYFLAKTMRDEKKPFQARAAAIRLLSEFYRRQEDYQWMAAHILDKDLIAGGDGHLFNESPCTAALKAGSLNGSVRDAVLEVAKNAEKEEALKLLAYMLDFRMGRYEIDAYLKVHAATLTAKQKASLRKLRSFVGK